MVSGNPRRILLRLKKKVGKRSKNKSKTDNQGVVYLPLDCVGHLIKIEVLEK